MPLICSYRISPAEPARGYETFFMLNSAEHEISNTHKYENIKKFSFFSSSGKPRMLFFPLINVKMPTNVGILTFMSRENFMPSRVEHEIFFITLGPDLQRANPDDDDDDDDDEDDEVGSTIPWHADPSMKEFALFERKFFLLWVVS